MNIYAEIEYWIEELQNDLHCFETEQKKEIVRNIFNQVESNGLLEYYYLEDKKGLIVYCITPDYIGNLTLQELFMYIKAPYRGSLKLFKELINHVEQVAKQRKCCTVRIGANLNYKDEKILKALKLLGYKTDVVVKHI